MVGLQPASAADRPVLAAASGYDKRWYIYSSYVFSSFGDRAWEFASVVLMVELYPGTLLYASLLGLLEAVTGILAGPAIGHYIDRNDRLTTIRTALVGQDLSIAAASLIFYLALTFGVQSPARELMYIIVLLCAAAARVASTTAKVSFNKDWIVALCGVNSQQLSNLNASTRRIDLSCSIAAPLMVGLLSTVTSPATAIASIGAWNILSLPVEYALAQWVYHNVPELQSQPAGSARTTTPHHTTAAVDEQKQKPAGSDAAKHHAAVPFEQDPMLHIEWHVAHLHSVRREMLSRVQLFFHATKYSWLGYLHHPSFMASLAYCFTYLSVISFGAQMTAYLKTMDFSALTLAAGRAAGALVGILATAMLPIMMGKVGVVQSAAICIWLQLACLLLVLLTFCTEQAWWSTWLLLGGIASSRFGLWGFDLAVSQIMQETVTAVKVGSINATQESMLSWMYLCSFLLGIVFSDPSTFIWPICISVGAVIAAAIMYTRWATGPMQQYQGVAQQASTELGT